MSRYQIDSGDHVLLKLGITRSRDFTRPSEDSTDTKIKAPGQSTMEFWNLNFGCLADLVSISQVELTLRNWSILNY